MFSGCQRQGVSELLRLRKTSTFCIACLAVSVSLALSLPLHAHPLDEFCLDGGMDPLLCAELSQLDSEAPAPEVQVFLDRSALETASVYIALGWEHILPWGLDHLAFVLALLLVAHRWQTAVLQISLFTAAHTVTIMLSAMGLVQLNSQFVEVAIAFSIVFVAVENIFLRKVHSWRYALIFIFGLLHGLGFAGALDELGIPDEHFIAAILGFNLGVELGQLAFAAVLFGVLVYFMKGQNYRKLCLLPASVAIAALACWWAIERLFF